MEGLRKYVSAVLKAKKRTNFFKRRSNAISKPLSMNLRCNFFSKYIYLGLSETTIKRASFPINKYLVYTLTLTSPDPQIQKVFNLRQPKEETPSTKQSIFNYRKKKIVRPAQLEIRQVTQA